MHCRPKEHRLKKKLIIANELEKTQTLCDGAGWQRCNTRLAGEPGVRFAAHSSRDNGSAFISIPMGSTSVAFKQSCLMMELSYLNIHYSYSVNEMERKIRMEVERPISRLLQ